GRRDAAHPAAETAARLRCRRQILHVEVDRADLRPEALRVEHAYGQAVARVAQLRRVHRELPAGVEAVDERIRLLHVRPPEAIRRRPDEVAVDDDLDLLDEPGPVVAE